MADDHDASEFESPQHGRPVKAVGSVNPYQAPQSDTDSPDSSPIRYGYNGKLHSNFVRTALAIALIGGVVSGLAYQGALHSTTIGGWIALLAMLWIGSFAMMGIFSGRALTERVSRAVGFGLLSLPMYVLFVPVCASGTLFGDTALSSIGLGAFQRTRRGECGLSRRSMVGRC